MITNRLKELITPYLLMSLEEEDYNKIEEMFSECYITVSAGQELITLKPIHEDNIAMQFSTLNGAFVEITDWDYIRSKGVRV